MSEYRGAALNAELDYEEFAGLYLRPALDAWVREYMEWERKYGAAMRQLWMEA